MALPVSYGVPYKVKLGKSFSDRNNNAFHTISYDFKPMSVDYSKPARMRVSEDEVIVSVPNVQAESNDDVTQFRGGKKICQKECVLIINTKTKEATLERVINSVQLKVLRTAKEKSKTPGKLTDRSISPLPNPPGQSLKLSNKLTGTLRSHSPSQAGRPPKKKKKGGGEAVVKEEPMTSLQVISHDPVTQQDVSSSHHKMKPDRPKPPSYTTSHASFSSSLSSSESDMDEVSMPTLTHGNSSMATSANGSMLGSLKKSEKSSDHDNSSSGSDTSSSESQSDDDDDDDSDEIDNTKHPSPRRPSMSVLHNDLHLSDPSSESDSD